jgi:hypothetical protein
LVLHTTGTVTVSSIAGTTATINGNIYIGTTASLVITQSGSGVTTVNGVVFDNGGAFFAFLNGGATINGALIASRATIGTSTPSSSGFINYNPTYIQNTFGGYYGSALTGGGGYGLVAGSMRDF